MRIVPAILSRTLDDVKDHLEHIKSVSTSVQIDICDGAFGALRTWIPNGKDALPSGFSYEFDIMLNDWKIPVSQCLLLKPVSIIIHFDLFSDADIQLLIKMIRPYDIMLGVAVSNDKDIRFHIDMVHKIKKMYKKVFVQVMGIRHIGQQGQPFDDKVPLRVLALKKEFKSLTIQVDGGVNTATIKLLNDVGVETVVVGSALFGEEDVKKAYDKLLSIVK